MIQQRLVIWGGGILRYFTRIFRWDLYKTAFVHTLTGWDIEELNDPTVCTIPYLVPDTKLVHSFLVRIRSIYLCVCRYIVELTHRIHA